MNIKDAIELLESLKNIKNINELDVDIQINLKTKSILNLSIPEVKPRTWTWGGEPIYCNVHNSSGNPSLDTSTTTNKL